MENKKINGLSVQIDNDIFIINESYKIKNIKKMKIILEKIFSKSNYCMTLYSKRKIKSFINEWIAKNNLYYLHLFRKKTTNIQFNYKIKIYKKIIYYILSIPNRIKYSIKKLKENVKIRKNEKLYKKYINEHKNNIKKAFEEMKNNPTIYKLGGQELLDKLYDRVLAHDNSKFSKEEFDAYRKNYYPISQEEKEENKDNFNKAWTHHWRSNSHHWQYRQNKKVFDKTNDEEVLDILENVLDWMAMGYKFHDRPYQYYENNKKHIFLNDEEKKFLEYIIYEGVDAEREIKTSKKYYTKEQVDKLLNKKRRFKLWKKKSKKLK